VFHRNVVTFMSVVFGALYDVLKRISPNVIFRGGVRAGMRAFKRDLSGQAIRQTQQRNAFSKTGQF
jgi:hypothetical protein